MSAWSEVWPLTLLLLNIVLLCMPSHTHRQQTFDTLPIDSSFIGTEQSDYKITFESLSHPNETISMVVSLGADDVSGDLEVTLGSTFVAIYDMIVAGAFGVFVLVFILLHACNRPCSSNKEEINFTYIMANERKLSKASPTLFKYVTGVLVLAMIILQWAFTDYADSNSLWEGLQRLGALLPVITIVILLSRSYSSRSLDLNNFLVPVHIQGMAEGENYDSFMAKALGYLFEESHIRPKPYGVEHSDAATDGFVPLQ